MVVKTIHAQAPQDWSDPCGGVGEIALNRLDMFIRCAAHMQHHIGQMIYLNYEWNRQAPKSPEAVTSGGLVPARQLI
jgi:hypothetical protein